MIGDSVTRVESNALSVQLDSSFNKKQVENSFHIALGLDPSSGCFEDQFLLSLVDEIATGIAGFCAAVHQLGFRSALRLYPADSRHDPFSFDKPPVLFMEQRVGGLFVQFSSWDDHALGRLLDRDGRRF